MIRDEAVLLVHQSDEPDSDFWVLPGGGLEEGESLDQCAEREVFEETGMTVKAERLLYVEEFIENTGQSAKLWFLCSEDGAQEIKVDNPDLNEQTDDARFLTKTELQGKTVYPISLKDRFWDDLTAGFTGVELLGPWDLRTNTADQVVKASAQIPNRKTARS